jgi:hypothetical protein
MKGAKSVHGRSIQAAVLVPAQARIAGCSRCLSTTGRDIAQVDARLDRMANDLAALQREVVGPKRQSARPRRRARHDANQLGLLSDARLASPDPISGGKPDEKEKEDADLA